MLNESAHRLQPGYTWEALHAFVTHFGPRLETAVRLGPDGRMKIRYQLQVKFQVIPGWARIAESYYSLRKGWQ